MSKNEKKSPSSENSSKDSTIKSQETSEPSLDELKNSLFDLIFQEDLQDRESLLKAVLNQIFDKLVQPLSDYFIVFLWSSSSISNSHLDFIYSALRDGNLDENQKPKKPVLLFLQSPGGAIEPAYQISKICHKFSKDKFIVAVPRRAKSAATLIALGADEVHMGHLSELGPIDPQVRGLPALGIKDSLREIADIVDSSKNSLEMFALYLKFSLDISFFGWCTRIAESAVQYGEKLLSMKHGASVSFSAIEAKAIADKLVNHYKNHSFVIDSDEAESVFNKPGFIHFDSDLIRNCERLYEETHFIFTAIEVVLNHELELIGSLSKGGFRMNKRRPER